MNRKRSDIAERRAKLLDMIRHTRDGVLNMEQAAKLLDVSAVTLRRDLVQLEEEGQISRSYGRVSLPEAERLLSDALNDPRTRIARTAAALVEPGDVVFVNTSRTALQMLRYVEAANVTVVTNNILAANVPHRSDMTIILTGGEVRYPKYAMLGDAALRTLRSVKASKAFLGCSGLTVERGMTTEHYAEVAVNSLMLNSVSGGVYLLADHTKLGWDSNFTSGGLSLIGHLITDRAATSETLAPFRAAGLDVRTV